MYFMVYIVIPKIDATFLPSIIQRNKLWFQVQNSKFELNTSIFYLILEKKTRQVEKKQSVDTQIKLLNIPLLL